MNRFSFLGVVSAYFMFAQSADALGSTLALNNEALAYKYQPQMKQIANTLWENPELGFVEYNSSELMQKVLVERGFVVTKGVAGMPTAFVAEYGTDGPTIGVLAEMDALPGMGVKRETSKQPISKNGQIQAGHACGHNLFAGGAIGAALSIADVIDARSIEGKIKVFGTPAEEGGSGKVYLVRDGLFDDVDIALHWHPSDSISASPSSSLANKSGKFRFYGIAAHAAAAPDKGRSALDGVEAMNMMVNLMREHVPDGSRIHYVITHGGTAPNVVPDFAEVYYYVRSSEPKVVLELWERLELAAQGAALGTQTRVETEVTGGVWNVLPNVALSSLVQNAVEQTPYIELSQSEQTFAQAMSMTRKREFDAQLHGVPDEYSENITVWSASTDVGDVSWQIPTVGLSSATWVKGTPPHTWQASALSGTDIGFKGMYFAAEVLAKTATWLFEDPALIDAAKKEFMLRKNNTDYTPMLGDRLPALNYRNATKSQ